MGTRRSDGEEVRSIQELGKFRRYWGKSPDYPEENFGNDHIHMPVDVVYEWADGRSRMEFSSILRVIVGSGPRDGDVDIDDTAKVRIEDFHLGFKAAFQKYKYDKTTKNLVVSASSPKMGGAYKVTISPSLQNPED